MAGEKKTVQPAGFVFDALLYRTWAVRRHLVLFPIVIAPAGRSLNYTFHRREFVGGKRYSTHLARGHVVLVSYGFDG